MSICPYPVQCEVCDAYGHQGYWHEPDENGRRIAMCPTLGGGGAVLKLISDHVMDRDDSHQPRERTRPSWYRLVRGRGSVHCRDCCSVCHSYHKGEFCPAQHTSRLVQNNLVHREFEPPAMPPYDTRMSPFPYPEARPIEDHETNEVSDPFPPHVGNQWVEDWGPLRAEQRE